jgi:outer membrane protein assembly factor BamB
MNHLLRTAVVALLLATMPAISQDVCAAHRVLLQGNGRLVILDKEGEVEWERPWGPIHDCHVLANGNVMVLQGRASVCEIDRQTKEVVWQYDAAASKDADSDRVEVHAFQPLSDGRVMIAETTRQRIIEIDRKGNVLKQIPMKIENPHPHTDTRLVRKLDSGNYLVCHEGDGTVREYAGDDGAIVWEYTVPMFGRQPAPGHGPEGYGNKVFSALRLENGNTLITTGNGHGVLQVTPEKEIVWRLQQHDLAGITLAWVTTVEVLENGNYVIGNCHAGPDNPLLIEINPVDKSVVWTLDQFSQFGNSVSNSQILDGGNSNLR